MYPALFLFFQGTQGSLWIIGEVRNRAFDDRVWCRVWLYGDDTNGIIVRPVVLFVCGLAAFDIMCERVKV